MFGSATYSYTSKSDQQKEKKVKEYLRGNGKRTE